MAGFDIRDLYFSVATYFATRQKNCIRLSFEEGEKFFGQPFNMVTIDSKGTTDGIMIAHYAEQLQESIENNLSLNSGLAIQKTWICLSESMLEACLQKLDEFTGILLYKQISEHEYKISEYRKAVKMHDCPYPAKTLSELLNIQAKEYWRMEKHNRDWKKFSKLI